MRGGGEHGVGGYLRPSTSGGRHRDAWHGGPGDRPAGPDDLQIIQRVTAVAEQHGHGLTSVDDAAAADRGNNVCAVLARGGHTSAGQLDRGLGPHREHHGRQPQPGQEPSVARRVRARAHQHPRPEAREHARQLRYPASTDHDAGRGGELETRRRHGELLAQRSLPAGNTAEYRVDARGSAIISATASRQAA